MATGLERTAVDPMTGRAGSSVPEMKPTPRDQRLGMIADALMSVRNFADRLRIPRNVPLLGGQGVGSMILGRAPEELVDISYGNAPVRVNPYAGRTASFVPEVKPRRREQVADLLALTGVPGGGRAAVALLGGVDDLGMGAERAMFVGAKSKTWDAASNARAVYLESQGVDPRTIWRETGNWRGPDGQWRQEISDLPAEMRADVSSGTVEQAMSHPDFFAAYPELAGASFKVDPLTSDSLYRSNPPTIEIGGIQKSGTISPMLHELQHAVQRNEGFARGGSVTAMMPENAGEILDIRQRIIDKIGNPKTSKKDIDKLRKQLATIENPVITAEKRYERLAGEVEARATQARKGMTQEQRRATFPEESYDVPVSDLIIRR